MGIWPAIILLLPFLSATSGRARCCVSHVPGTRPTCGPTPVVDLPTCCMDAPQDQSSQLSVCECGALVDTRGRHRAACPHSGRLRTRAVAPERTLARICREAGATVRPNVKLRDMNVLVRADDERCIKVLASGLPLFHGAQLAVDITLRCALTCGGDPRPGAARADGIVCNTARAEKERTCGS